MASVSFTPSYNVYRDPLTGPVTPFLLMPGYGLATVGSIPGEQTPIHLGRHTHGNSETYVVLGDHPFSMEVAGQRITLNKGDVFTVPPNTEHGMFESPQGYHAVLIEGMESGQLGGVNIPVPQFSAWA